MSDDKNTKKASTPRKPKDPNAPKPYRMGPADKAVVKKALAAYKEVVNGYAEHPEFNKADALANIDRIIESIK